MTRELKDKVTFTGNIGNASTETFTVDTSRAEDLIILVDDGTTDNQPAEYTMTQRVYSTGLGDFQFYDEVTTSTSRSFTDPAWGSQMEIQFENTSGSSSNYRITIEAYRTLD